MPTLDMAQAEIRPTYGNLFDFDPPTEKYNYDAISNDKLREFMGRVEEELVGQKRQWPMPAKEAFRMLGDWGKFYWVAVGGTRFYVTDQVLARIITTRSVILKKDTEVDRNPYYITKDGFRAASALTWMLKETYPSITTQYSRVRVEWDHKVFPALDTALGQHTLGRYFHNHNHLSQADFSPRIPRV